MVHARSIQVIRVLLIIILLSIVSGCGGSGTMSTDRPTGDLSNEPADLTITASAGDNGSITPSGQVRVERHGTMDFLIVPASGYQVDSVHVDGSYVGIVTNYSFTNVTKPHSIRAAFVLAK